MAEGESKFQWMPSPQAGDLRCPPGLKYLKDIDHILIHQEVESLEAVVGFETPNKYSILNSNGEIIFQAVEDTNCCVRQCCGPVRPFSIRVLDQTGKEVIYMERPLRCQTWCCFCCLQKVEVQSPPGGVIGYVQQDFSLVYPLFSIRDVDGEVMLRIKGPFLSCKWCDVEFQVLSANNEPMGKITKQWSGLAKEFFTDADNFGIQFPKNLSPEMKAVVIGAAFLIDFMYFEQSN